MAAPPQINLNELYSIQDQKKKNRVVCFNHVLQLCHRRIRMVSSYGGQNTFYEIPGVLIGFPLFDINECTEYIVNALRRNGLLVQILPPPHYHVIYLSWAKTDVASQKQRITHSAPSLPQSTKVLPPKRSPLRLF